MSVHPQVRVVVRPYGSPIPLGFFAFGIGMFLYAALGAGWVKPSDQHTVGMLLALFVFPLQIVATIFAFLARDGAAGTALGLFSTSWLAGGVLLATGTPGTLDRTGVARTAIESGLEDQLSAVEDEAGVRRRL